MHHVEVERVFSQPIEVVFARYVDHAGWSEWAGLGRVRVVQKGSPDPNGVGAVRAFALEPRLREQVVLFEPPRRMDYRVTQGAYPLTDHHGEVLFASEGAGTRVTWRVSFRSKIAVLGRPITLGLGWLFRRILAGLARDLDRRG